MPFNSFFHIMPVFYRENTISVKKIRIDSAENSVISLLAQHKMHPSRWRIQRFSNMAGTDHSRFVFKLFAENYSA